MLMPETAVNENDLPMRRQDQIRFTGKPRNMQTKAKAQLMDQRSHDPLGLRVFRPNPRHVERTLCRRVDVCHGDMFAGQPLRDLKSSRF